MLGVLLLTIGLWAQASVAQVTAFGEYLQADTRFGTFTMTTQSQSGVTGLLLNGLPTGVEAYRLRILGAYAYPNEDADWLLVETAHGGNMCPVSYVLMRATAQGVTRTGEFAECLGLPKALWIEPGRVRLEVLDPSLSIDYQSFDWDGASGFTVTPVPVVLGQGAGPALTGMALLQWVGQPSGAILQDPTVQAQFLSILSADQLEDLYWRMGVPNTVERWGNWILGSGCQPHMCNASAAVWGIRLSDGAPVTVFLERDAPEIWAGAPDITADAVVRSYVEARRWQN